MDDKEALIALNMIPHVGPVRLRNMQDRIGAPAAILSASKDQLLRVPGIGEAAADAIVGWESGVDLQGELRRIQEFGCHVVTWSDEEYPPLLKQIYDPPILLYVKGTLSPRDKNSVAIVGSRQTTHYGMNVARKFGYQLAYVGVTVVSGGARGIDTAAHQGALNAKGRTIGVLGTGINIVFPSVELQCDFSVGEIGNFHCDSARVWLTQRYALKNDCAVGLCYRRRDGARGCR